MEAVVADKVKDGAAVGESVPVDESSLRVGLGDRDPESVATALSDIDLGGADIDRV